MKLVVSDMSGSRTVVGNARVLDEGASRPVCVGLAIVLLCLPCRLSLAVF